MADVDISDILLAIANRFLTTQGLEVVTQGKLRLLDSHSFRGSSWLGMG